MLEISGYPLHARFIVRQNRFTATVEYNGAHFTAHVPTTGRMRELLLPGAEVTIVERAHPGRSTDYDLVMVRRGATWVSIDSRVPNRLLESCFRTGILPEFRDWIFSRREVPLGESRLDFLLERERERCWVESKSVTLVRDGTAFFPDAPTKRGARHLAELAQKREEGDHAAIIFVIQRSDALRFSPNRETDPEFARSLEHALQRGVAVYAYTCRVLPERIDIDHLVEVCL